MHFSDDTTAKKLDTLMQDTWLLALAIRNHPPVTVDDALHQRCVGMIKQVQDQLAAAGAAESLREEIKFAHCVFLDEAVMTQPNTDVSTWWWRTPLQGLFLEHLQGGEYFYEHIKTLLRQPKPSATLVVCYYRMLQFGYTGKYRTEDAEARLSLMRQLEKLLPVRSDQEEDLTIVVSSAGREAHWWYSPPVVLLSLLLLAVGIHTGLRLFLLAQ